MQHLVQSALEAAKRGDKNKAFELLKQALTANPNDVEAMLALMSLTDQPERKRQILERVLRVDPVNKVAREELTNLDRLAMGAFLAESEPPAKPKLVVPPSVISKDAPPARSTGNSTEQPAPAAPRLQPSPTSQETPKLRIDKPVVFRYPFRGRVGYFVVAAIFGCLGLVIISQGDATSLPLLCMGILFGLAALSNQASVTVSETGIQVSNLLSKTQVTWRDIASMRSNALRKKLELGSSEGNTLKISTQIEGYPALVEILRQKRPDLFNASPSSSGQNHAVTNGFEHTPSMNTHGTNTPAFSGVRTFSKNFFAQYGILLLMLPFCIVGPLLIYLNSDWFAGIGLGLIGLFFMVASLFNISQIKLEPNKLTAESFLSQKEFTAKQIKEISMKTTRTRRGIAMNFVNIQPVEGNAISMAGFPEGEEIIYGTLMDWWNTYKNR